MKTRRILALLLALLTTVLIAGCGPSTTPAPSTPSSPSAAAADQSAATAASPETPSPAPAGPVTVTDFSGRTVTFDKPVQRIVVLTASDCEILYALGAGASVVGRGKYCDYPKAVLDITSVQSGSDTNIEQLIALKPDVVIMSQMAQTPEQAASLEGAGVKVVETYAQNIDGIYTAITLLGQVVGKNDEAKTIISEMKKTFDDIKAKIPAGSSKSIYFEVSPLQYGLYAAGAGTFMDEIGTMLGLKNIFADTESWAQVSEEQVIQRNPDFIVTTTMSQEGAPNPVDEILGRKGWGDIPAVENKAIYNADSNSSALMHPGPRLAQAAQELYNFVYGK
jgi:iron complex transport system substrate-binding protein